MQISTLEGKPWSNASQTFPSNCPNVRPRWHLGNLGSISKALWILIGPYFLDRKMFYFLTILEIKLILRTFPAPKVLPRVPPVLTCPLIQLTTTLESNSQIHFAWFLTWYKWNPIYNFSLNIMSVKTLILFQVAIFYSVSLLYNIPFTYFVNGILCYSDILNIINNAMNILVQVTQYVPRETFYFDFLLLFYSWC